MNARPLVLSHAPSAQELARFLDTARGADLSYAEHGATRGSLPPGYDHDHARARVGAGRDVYEQARAALDRWAHFPPGWARVHPAAAPVAGEAVCVAFRVAGLWWLNAARVLYRLDESGVARSAGFAYGTLECHVERGEECFRVDWESDDSVWYDVRAFSRPAWWPVRMAKPLARALQRRFVRDSQEALRAALRARSP